MRGDISLIVILELSTLYRQLTLSPPHTMHSRTQTYILLVQHCPGHTAQCEGCDDLVYIFGCTKHYKNNFAAPLASVGRLHPVNHTHMTSPSSSCINTVFFMPLDSHSLNDLWESSPKSTKGCRLYKYIVNGTDGFTLSREARRNELCSLIFSYQLSVRKGLEKRTRQHQGKRQRQ